MPNLGAWESYRTPHFWAGKQKWWFSFSKITITRTSLNLHFAPVRTRDIPNFPKKSKVTVTLAHHNHLYPSRWLLLTTNCCLGPRYTWYCHRTSNNCTGLSFWSFWVCAKKLVQVAVNCHGSFGHMEGVHYTWIKIYFLANIIAIKWFSSTPLLVKYSA